MALIAFANALLDQSFSKWTPFVRKELYDGLDYKETQSVIKADLDYICEYVPRVACPACGGSDQATFDPEMLNIDIGIC